MTCREKLALEHPEWSDYELGFNIGSSCPGEYGLQEVVEDCSDCRKCWDSEIPEVKKIDEVKEAMQKVGDAAKKAGESIKGNIAKLGPIDLDKVCTTIKDSGNRTEFETGAVRDMREGKGRFDLMPLGVVAEYIHKGVKEDGTKHDDKYWFIRSLDWFLQTNDTSHLYSAMAIFEPMAFEYSSDMLLEVAKHFEEGANKYGPDNWKRGIPVWCYIDSAMRHFVKYCNGDTDERHDRAVMWNLMCCIWEVDYRNKENGHETD